MQTLTLPEVGKTYRSTLEPDLSVNVFVVHRIKANPAYGIHEPDYLVEACIIDSVHQIEMLSDEWEKHQFYLTDSVK